MATRLVAGLIALLAGAGLMRLWDHRDVALRLPPNASTPPPAPPLAFARSFRASHFVRGNLHTHTTRSDGDATPDDVARWYRDHGYDFLALTDHNLLSSPPDSAALATPALTLIPGEEVSMWVHGLQVHVNALCTHAPITGGEFPRATDALEHAIGEVRAQNGVALVNHPNFDWALTQDDVLGADGANLLEIASGHPYVHTPGDATRPSHEQLWDAALTAGLDVMGVAVDDTHHLRTDADPEAFPGVAWVAVFADEVRVDTVCDALRRGALYASTGLTLRGIEVSGDAYGVEPADDEAVVTFIGSGGRTLWRAPWRGGAQYHLTGGEGYVRARIEGPTGIAWAPAVRVERPASGL
jgi:hypothetical protein